MITLTNRIGGQLVCTLNDGSTLRVDNNKEIPIMDNQVTSYLKNLEKLGLVTCKVQKEKISPVKGKEKEKEDKENA